MSGVETERKFHVDAVPDDFDRSRASKIEQGYLAIGTDGSEVRVRRRGSNTTLTAKRGRGLQRGEVELSLDPEEFERLWPLTDGRRVEKTRYVLDGPSGEQIEVDVYAGALAGLIVAEVEFESVSEAERFEPPSWFGTEVTEDDAYKNRALAVDGRPEAGASVRTLGAAGAD